MGDKAKEFKEDILADRKKSRKTKTPSGRARPLEDSMYADRLLVAKLWKFGASSMQDKNLAPSNKGERTRKKTGKFDFSNNEELDSSDDDSSRADKSNAQEQDKSVDSEEELQEEEV
jgi:hypothetical protein